MRLSTEGAASKTRIVIFASMNTDWMTRTWAQSIGAYLVPMPKAGDVLAALNV